MEAIKEIRYFINKILKLNESIYSVEDAWSFQIKNFTPQDEEWNSYIKPNKNDIWEFLNKGYNAAGLEKFKSCSNPKNMFKNACLIKIAFYKDVWVAISVYTGYRGGKKNVGITATLDEQLKPLGINAVKQIIKDDIDEYDEFYWTECSGAIEHLYEKYGGIKIPNEFAFNMVGGDAEPLNNNDIFHYTRTIEGEKEVKIIYGFNSLETYNEVKTKYSEYIEDCIKKIEQSRLNENIYPYREIDNIISIINIFVDLRWESEMYEFPAEQLENLKNYVNKLDYLINKDDFPNEKYGIAKQCLNNGKNILKTSLPMKINLYKKNA